MSQLLTAKDYKHFYDTVVKHAKNICKEITPNQNEAQMESCYGVIGLIEKLRTTSKNNKINEEIT